MGNYQDLRVWQLARELAARVDRETRQLRRGHADLADQLRRATLSIPTNLAEGSTRGRDGEFVRFVNIAIGSAAETESLLLHARDVEALDERTQGELEAAVTLIRKMLFKLRAALSNARERRGPPAAPPSESDHEPATRA